jgi:transposase-like protein
MTEEIVEEEKMKCPSCSMPMKHNYRQQGGIRTHDYYECKSCRLYVVIHQVEDTRYESPIDRFKRWMEARK